MTYSRTPLTSMGAAADKAARREYKRDRIEAWHKARRRKWRQSEPYKQAVEENARLGIVPHRLTDKECVLALNSCKSRRAVTLPGAKSPEVDERTAAEDRAIEAVKQAVQMLSFHLTALVHIPNPTPRYRNRVDQKVLAEMVRRISHCVTPPISSFLEKIGDPERVPLVRMCIDCGGPATHQKNNRHWYCDDCG
jgi:hypothetical protein